MYFFLLVLGILLHFGPDASHKQGEFFKILPNNGLAFVPSKRDGILTSNQSFVLLLMEINLISEKQRCKRDMFVACSSSCVEITLILLTEIITLNTQAFIVKVKVLGLEQAIAKCNTCLKLAKIPAFNKQF